MAKLRVTWTKSGIGYAQDQKDTIRGLGLHKLQDAVTMPDSPTIRGMLRKVRHLVTTETIDEAE
jgi:large subunit ribosomal protein L30